MSGGGPHLSFLGNTEGVGVIPRKLGIHWVLLLVLLLSGTMAVGWGATPPPAATDEEGSTTEEQGFRVSLESLAENPEEYVGCTVRVSGTLYNIGKNYFRDLDVVLQDEKEHSISVIPWVPTSIPSLPPGATKTRPPILSNYLNKQIKLIGVLERVLLEDRSQGYMLRVKSASIIQE